MKEKKTNKTKMTKICALLFAVISSVWMMSFLSGFKPSTFSVTNYLGTKTPYPFTTYPPNAELFQVQQDETLSTYEPVQLNYLIRHGTRNPTEKDIRKMTKLASKLQLQHPQQIPDWLREWQIPFKMEEAGQLNHIGVEDMLQLGARVRQKYATGFPNVYRKESFIFEHTWKIRTKQSALAFADGFFGGHQPVHFETEEKGNDEELRFFDNCPEYEKKVEDNSTAMMQFTLYKNSYRMRQNAATLQEKLGISSEKEIITVNDVITAYTACSFDASVLKIYDQWCSLFTPTMLKSLDYFKDLKNYYKKSYGNPMAWQISSVLLQDIYTSLFNYTIGKNTVKAHFRFAHAETLLPLLALLGTVPEQKHFPLKANEPEEIAFSREFKSSILSPFAGNVGFILYKCRETKKYLIRIEINERIFHIKECGLKSESLRVAKKSKNLLFLNDCSLDGFQHKFKNFLFHWNFEEKCVLPPKRGNAVDDILAWFSDHDV